MNNFHNKAKNHICPCCGRDSYSHKLGMFIRNRAKELRKQDKQADAVNVLIPLRKFIGKPQYFAFLIYNPWN